MKLPIDMNLSPLWVSFLAGEGVDAIHRSAVGRPQAADSEILDFAAANGWIVFTPRPGFADQQTRCHSGPGAGRSARRHRRSRAPRNSGRCTTPGSRCSRHCGLTTPSRSASAHLKQIHELCQVSESLVRVDRSLPQARLIITNPRKASFLRMDDDPPGASRPLHELPFRDPGNGLN
jgi:hypothetical protein